MWCQIKNLNGNNNTCQRGLSKAPKLLKAFKQNKVMPLPNEPAENMDNSPVLKLGSPLNSLRRVASDHSLQLQEDAEERESAGFEFR